MATTKKSTSKKFDLQRVAAEATTPVYAYIGATDLAIEKVREAGMKAGESAKTRPDVTALLADVQEAAAKFVAQAQEAVTEAPTRARELAESLQESYEDLATRGEKLVDRIRNQKATKDLVDQAKSTVAMTEGVVTTAKKAVADVEASAKATLTTGRKEAVKLAESMTADAVETAAEAKEAAKRTRTAAKRATTTTKNRAATTKSATESASTSARKTATATRKAAAAAAEKVGD